MKKKEIMSFCLCKNQPQQSRTSLLSLTLIKKYKNNFDYNRLLFYLFLQFVFASKDFLDMLCAAIKNSMLLTVADFCFAFYFWTF